MEVVIETENLVLRKFKMEDDKDCIEFLSDCETCYLDGGYEPFLEMDERFYNLMNRFEKQDGRLMIELKSENKVIGTINIRDSLFRVVKSVEIGYCLNPNYRRRGYASEAIQAIIQYLFHICDVELITAKAYELNEPSIRLLEKLGFKYEGKLYKAFQYPGREPESLVCYYYDR